MIQSVLKIYNSFKPICSELGIKNVEFDVINEKLEDSDTIAAVCLDNIYDAHDIDKSIDEYEIFKMKFEPKIKIYKDYFDVFIDDLYDNCLNKKSDKLLELLKIICLENSIVHELKHLHQFMTINLTFDNIDIKVDNENKTFSYVLNKETKFELEKEANKYSLSKCDITTIEDKELKNIVTNLEYNNICGSIYRDFFETEFEENIKDINYPKVEDASNYKTELNRWLNELNVYIEEKY